MDGQEFDTLVKRLTAARFTRLEALRGLIASIVVGLTGATRADAAEAKTQAKPGGRNRKKTAGKKKHTKARVHGAGQPKVLLCHKGQTLEVAEPAVAAHLGHGDSLGACGTAPPAGTCVPLDQVCSVFSATKCCAPSQCRSTGSVVVTTCQVACISTLECQQLLRTPDVECVQDGAACPGLLGCCRPTTCSSGSQCPGGGPCCPTLSGPPRCCAGGQTCAPLGGCASQ